MVRHPMQLTTDGSGNDVSKRHAIDSSGKRLCLTGSTSAAVSQDMREGIYDLSGPQDALLLFRELNYIIRLGTEH